MVWRVWLVALALATGACTSGSEDTQPPAVPTSVTPAEATTPATTTPSSTSTSTSTTVVPKSPADTGLEWEEVETGDVFAGAIVTDAVAGPGGYVAVGHSIETDEGPEPRVWHSSDGVTWIRVDGDLGLAPGFVTGQGPTPIAGFFDGSIDDRPLVVTADESGYLLAARRHAIAAPAGEECRAVASLASSRDGLVWTPAGSADLGRQNQQVLEECALPGRGAAFIPIGGQMTGIALSGDQAVLVGVARWARAYATGDTSTAVWVGPRSGDLLLMTEKTDNFTALVDVAALPGGTVVGGGFSNAGLESALFLVGDGALDEAADSPVVENRAISVSGMDSDERGVVAVGINEHAFGDTGVAEFIAWHSTDGITWLRDVVEGDVADAIGYDVAIGPAGPVAIAGTDSLFPDPIVFRFTDGTWHRVDGDLPDELAFPRRLLATSWGVIAFTHQRDTTALFASGAPPAQ